MLTKVTTTLAAAGLLVSASASVSYADSFDDCVLKITYECLDDSDFWGCYDIGTELCENQNVAVIVVLPEKAAAQKRKQFHVQAQSLLQQHQQKLKTGWKTR